MDIIIYMPNMSASITANDTGTGTNYNVSKNALKTAKRNGGARISNTIVRTGREGTTRWKAPPLAHKHTQTIKHQ